MTIAWLTFGWMCFWMIAGHAIGSVSYFSGLKKTVVDKNKRLAWERNLASTGLLYSLNGLIVFAVGAGIYGLMTSRDYLPGGSRWSERWDGYCYYDSQPILVGAAFAGYLISEIVLELAHFVLYKTRVAFDLVLHHFLFLAVAAVNVSLGRLCGPFHLLITTETSTVMLNLRWFFGATGSRNGFFAKLNDVLFVIVFFCTRIVLYGFCVVDLLVESPHKYTLFAFDFITFVDALIIAGYGLNLLWFVLIIKKAIKSDAAAPKVADRDKDK